MKKWQFDESTIKSAIDAGNRFLLDDSLSRKHRLEITSDIRRFQRFLNGDYELLERKRYLKHPQLKNNILRAMRKHSKIFDKNFISWLIGLAQSNIFARDEEVPIFSIPIEEAANHTIENYKRNSPIFYQYAYELLRNKKINLIQETPLEGSPYCFYSDILRLPFIVINSSTEASTLNHEMQHAIEYLLGITTSPFYSEFGPIYFETLLTDQLFSHYGKDVLSSILNRICDTQRFLDFVKCYLYPLSVFSHFNFDVDDELFYSTFHDITNLQGEELIRFLNEEMVASEITDTLGYLFSYLKVIEIRSLAKRDNLEVGDEFNRILYDKTFKFEKPKNGFQVYKDFVDEIQEKAR